MIKLFEAMTTKQLLLAPLPFVIAVAATFISARTSGWRTLSQKFIADDSIEGETFRFVSGTLGKRKLLRIRYSHSIFITLSQKGMYIAPLFLLRLSHSPLMIPWSQINCVESKRQLGLFEYFEITFKDTWPILQLHGKAGKKTLEAFTKYAQTQERQSSNWRNK